MNILQSWIGERTEKWRYKNVNNLTTSPNLMKAIIKFYVFDNIISLKYEAMQIAIFWTYFAQMSLYLCVDPLIIDQLNDKEKVYLFFRIITEILMILAFSYFSMTTEALPPPIFPLLLSNIILMIRGCSKIMSAKIGGSRHENFLVNH